MNSFLTIGQCSAVLQCMPADIRRAAEELSITPTSINFVDAFSEGQLAEIRLHLSQIALNAHVMHRRASLLN